MDMDIRTGKKIITRDQAISLLYRDRTYESNNQMDYYFDEFGNYHYPSDIVLDTPNIASGTADYNYLF